LPLRAAVRRNHRRRNPPAWIPKNMKTPAVSLHPYFKVNAGQLAAAKTLLRAFVAKTQTEPGCHYYEFTLDGDVVFCREAYADADAVLAHLANVGPELGEMLKIAALTRLELHGPAAELDKLRGPLADLKPAWFVFECGVQK
jgi:hypothetical protein